MTNPGVTPVPVARTRIKMCGITRPADARDAITAGADAIGLIFYRSSARCVSREQAQQIRASVPPFVTLVGVFVNESATKVDSLADECGLDLVQLHGDEDGNYCDRLDRPYIKAIRVKPGLDLSAAMAEYVSARGFLFDSHRQGSYGGTGEAFDWQRIPVSERPIIVAGGLDAGNVERVIARARPFAVDVSSGIEQAAGIKDSTRMRQFVTAVRQADVLHCLGDEQGGQQQEVL